MTAKLAQGPDSAITEYRVLKRFDKFTFLEVKIGTGRTHQIRVHLASIGHPVAGDKLYGAPASALGRYFLHAHSITFTGPSSGERITISAPVPAELQQYLDHLKPAQRSGTPAIINSLVVMRILYSAAALFAFSLVVNGQSSATQSTQALAPPSSNSEDTRITLDVSRVNMLFTVSDKKGRFVTDLDQGRFRGLRKQEAAKHHRIRGRVGLAAAAGHPDRYQQ